MLDWCADLPGMSVQQTCLSFFANAIANHAPLHYLCDMHDSLFHPNLNDILSTLRPPAAAQLACMNRMLCALHFCPLHAYASWSHVQAT